MFMSKEGKLKKWNEVHAAILTIFRVWKAQGRQLFFRIRQISFTPRGAIRHYQLAAVAFIVRRVSS